GCIYCHGAQGQGGFGPDLAGRGLTFAQFKRAVIRPWGIMPRFMLSDQVLADIYAYLQTLPKVAEPAQPRNPPPPGAPRGQYVATVQACTECHGMELADPRRGLGEWGDDFETLKHLVYDHDQVYPRNRMGVFSRDRLTESTLREVFDFASKDLGARVPI